MMKVLLQEVQQAVEFRDQKQFVCWVATVTCYFTALRKSNIVPVTRKHDPQQNITRSDVRYGNGVMVIIVRWSKTNQFQEKEQTIPIVADNNSLVCPARWLLHMMESIHTVPDHNLFSYIEKG